MKYSNENIENDEYLENGSSHDSLKNAVKKKILSSLNPKQVDLKEEEYPPKRYWDYYVYDANIIVNYYRANTSYFSEANWIKRK